MEIEQALIQAEQSILRNQKAQARALLAEIVRQSPNCEEAWLMSAQVTDKPEQVLYCLQRALKINPGSVKARQLMDRFQEQQVPAPVITQPEPVQRSEPVTKPRQPLPEEQAPAAAIVQAGPVPYSEPITQPNKTRRTASSNNLPGWLEVPKPTQAGVPTTAGSVLASQNSVPDWMLVLLKDAETALGNQNQPAFIQKTDQIIRAGEAAIPALVWYRRAKGPDSDGGRVADAVLRQIHGIPEDKEIEKYEKVPKQALVGLLIGGMVGLVIGVLAGDIGSVFGMMAMFAVFVWMIMWAGSTTLSRGAIRYFPQILFPIVAIWKAIEHGSILNKIKDNRRAFYEHLAQLEKQGFPEPAGGAAAQSDAILSALPAVQPGNSLFYYPLTLTESGSELVISRRDQPLMAYVPGGKKECMSKLVGLDGNGSPDKKQPLYQMIVESQSKSNGKPVMVIRIEEVASLKALGRIQSVGQTIEIYRMDGVKWGSFLKQGGDSAIMYQDLERKGQGISFERTKTGLENRATLSRSSEYEDVFSDEEEIVFLFTFAQSCAAHFLAWKIERNWL